jgi:hypothetical protein
MRIFASVLFIVALAIAGSETTTTLAFVVSSHQQARFYSSPPPPSLATTTVSPRALRRLGLHGPLRPLLQEGVVSLYPKTGTRTNTAIQSSFLDSFDRLFERRAGGTSPNQNSAGDTAEAVVRRFLQAYDNGDIDEALSLWKQEHDNDDENTGGAIEFADVSFYNSLTSKRDMERQWRLQHADDASSTAVAENEQQRKDRRLVIDNMAIDPTNNSVGVKFHYEQLLRGGGGENSSDCWIPAPAPNGRGCALVQLEKRSERAAASTPTISILMIVVAAC